MRPGRSRALSWRGGEWRGCHEDGTETKGQAGKDINTRTRTMRSGRLVAAMTVTCLSSSTPSSSISNLQGQKRQDVSTNEREERGTSGAPLSLRVHSLAQHAVGHALP